MSHFTTIMPTMKELEQWIFRKMQEEFASAMKKVLEMLDQQILEQRDRERYRVKDEREASVNTVFGNIRFKRRLYHDRQSGKYVYLLDRMLQFEGRGKVSPHLEETAIVFASQGPSYRDSAKRLEQLLGYSVLSHQAIREKLLVHAEREMHAVERRPARVLFVEVDGLYTKLQRSKRRGMENAIAVVHEGWEKNGKRVELKNKQYYLHTTSGDFWEGFGDFLVERYEIDENTWLVVNGDGAAWIGESESYFHQCLYMLDRFHVARDLKRFVGHLPSVWEAVRQSLAKQDAAALMTAVEGVTEQEIAAEYRKDWKQYKSYLKRHQKHLDDYRKTLQAKGIDTSAMRPMGSAESQMRVFAKRTKRGGYSWSERGVRAMLRTMMRSREAHVVQISKQRHEKKQLAKQVNMRQLMRNVTRQVKGCVTGMIRLLQGPKQSSTTGMALKGLRG
ncbi:hypothetical protein PN4B1_19690 [Paenibacillus naphthalenovorans]|uniref:ISLre2 family transposase n=1 Tax=Paenibacillus naphthalenovorans TaxID=162209 RepID=UPI0010B481CE|nr:ISLre2 family transposase [Paenibacillus naphthalenovorans]GCL72052.1 hypothetical protein PN4B1_19570 [Paenibacillus naphthalenovorans]GCL72064.1 hypothetical protein PN4B1_19690 [Paenibacillus naphthalenovorans]